MPARYRECHRIAAVMLCEYGDPDPRQIHPAIVAMLDSLEALCAKDHGHLRSRQIVALAVTWWLDKFPAEKPWGHYAQ
jgi:hypothetical protein